MAPRPHLPNRFSELGMDDIEVSRSDLLARLVVNRDAHYAIYMKAVETFKTLARKELEEKIKEIDAGHVPSMYIDLPVPEEHTDDYNRAIRMVEMHANPTLKLPEAAYLRLVEDDWGWRATWYGNTVAYVGAGHD